MGFFLLLFAWLMLVYSHYEYTISHPVGLFYSDFGEYFTAFMYQPLLNTILVLFVLLSMLIIYGMIYAFIKKLIDKKWSLNMVEVLKTALLIFLTIQGYIYYPEVSILFFIVTVYYVLLSWIRKKKGRIGKYTHF